MNHSSSFNAMLLKPEITRAIKEAGFENPSQGSTTLLENFNDTSLTTMHSDCH